MAFFGHLPLVQLYYFISSAAASKCLIPNLQKSTNLGPVYTGNKSRCLRCISNSLQLII